MAPHPNDLFILGEEELGAEAPDVAAAADGESGRRSPFAAASEPVPALPRVSLGRGRMSRRAVVGGLLAGSVTLVVVLVLSEDGGVRIDTPRAHREPAPVMAEPAPSPPARLPRPERAGRRIRAAHKKAPRGAGKASKRRPSGWAEREPTSEQAPVSPPIDETGPAPEAAPVSASPSPIPSPPRSPRGGSGGRPEFGFER
jgi:hypothetical protein